MSGTAGAGSCFTGVALPAPGKIQVNPALRLAPFLPSLKLSFSIPFQHSFICQMFAQQLWCARHSALTPAPSEQDGAHQATPWAETPAAHGQCQGQKGPQVSSYFHGLEEDPLEVSQLVPRFPDFLSRTWFPLHTNSLIVLQRRLSHPGEP